MSISNRFAALSLGLLLGGCILPVDESSEYRASGDFTLSSGSQTFWGVRTTGGIRSGGLDGPKLIAFDRNGIYDANGALLCAITGATLRAGPSTADAPIYDANGPTLVDASSKTPLYRFEGDEVIEIDDDVTLVTASRRIEVDPKPLRLAIAALIDGVCGGDGLP